MKNLKKEDLKNELSNDIKKNLIMKLSKDISANIDLMNKGTKKETIKNIL